MPYARALLPCLVGHLLCIAPAFAAEDGGKPNPPLNDFFQTDAVFPQDAGEWQVSAGADSAKSATQKTTALSTKLEYGVTDSVQAELEYTPYIRIQPTDGSGDAVHGRGNTALGLQKSWMNIGGSRTSIAAGYGHEFANGDPAVIADDNTEPQDSDEAYVTLARNLDDSGNNQASLQLGNERSSAGNNTAFANLAAFHAVGKHVFTGEYNWSKAESWVTPGIFWKPAKGLEVGAAVAFGVNGTDGHQLLTRLTYEFD
jgi:hypothetical protein